MSVPRLIHQSLCRSKVGLRFKAQSGKPGVLAGGVPAEQFKHLVKFERNMMSVHFAHPFITL